MTYFERYRAGDHVEVWAELGALGHTVRDRSVISDAEAVARATMERVATNIDRIAARLAHRGFEFGVYPDGTKFLSARAARIEPDSALLDSVSELEGLTGPLPIALRTFWETVGSVSFIGRAPDGWPAYSDPLYVELPQGGIDDFKDWQIDSGQQSDVGAFRCPIAPDFFHKDNISGGAPYSMSIPDTNVDGILRDEWHNVSFVDYLRITILEWGGFPGLSLSNPYQRWRTNQLLVPSWFSELTSGLESF